ncbi:MAG: hypothetical protein IPK63_15725 [Candidatus Competibacteraceae bacterium]|nr:hypothetical protein [Candidatus Competibacteraceae bacterium]MBK8184245.1 hypothetical protein [Candidatus Competibacteraceae bacterium]
MLQTASGQTSQAPQNQAPPAVEPQAYAQQLQQEAYQAIQQRPEITAQELFGKDALEELGLSNQNYTPVLEQFIHATIAPVIGTLLSQMYALQHGVDQRFTDVQPMVQQAQFNQTQQEMGRKFITAFPALATDANAKAFAEKRFNDLAPLLMPRELLMNPHTNPAEYARLTESIVAIAAKEYQAPAAAPATPPPVAVSPAPPVQPAPSAYRNHLGQFQAAQPPTTLDAYNQQRIKTLFPGR